MINKDFVDKQFKQLDDPNFNVDTLDRTGRSLLFLACKICDKEKILTLIEKNCNLNLIDNLGHNCLGILCSLPRTEQFNETVKLELFKFLSVDHKVDIWNLTNKEESCLYLACKYGNVEIAEYILLTYPEMLDLKPLSGASCLEIAIICNNKKILDLLLKYGADVNDMNDESAMSCLMVACANKRTDMVKELHKRGAEINLVNFKNRNALYYATFYMNENDETILYLLENNSFMCDRTCKLLSRSTNEKILKYIIE